MKKNSDEKMWICCDSDDLFLLICIRLLDFPLFVLAPYRATPYVSTGKAPSELLMGCMMKTRLPDLKDFTQKDDRDTEVRKRDRDHKLKYKEYTDRRRRAMSLEVKAGDNVVVVKDYY